MVERKSQEPTFGSVWNLAEVLEELRELAALSNIAGMERFGIETRNALGVRIPDLRKLAKKLGTNHPLALELWASNLHEARILATMIEDPKLVSEAQMDAWAEDFDSWDLCDQCCMNLFRKTNFAYEKCIEWSSRQEEFVKRAAFAMMVALTVHDKKASDEDFERFLPLIMRGAVDSRNFVKKAVSWALRQIGKRNLKLNEKAIEKARKIQELDSKSASWIASDALRELENEKIQKRLEK